VRARRAAGAAAVLLAVLGGTASAQEKLSVTLTAAGVFPRDGLVRRIYGTGLAAAADVWLKLKGPLGLAAGFSRLADTGAAASFSAADDEVFPVRFRRQTVPVVLFYRIGLGGADLRAGAGLAVHGFREAWQTVDLDYKGHGWGPRFLLAARVRLFDRLSCLASVVYDSFRAGADSPNAGAVALGGFQVGGGLSWRVY